MTLCLPRSGDTALGLTQCLWNSLPHAFHLNFHLLAFSTLCQASVELAWVNLNLWCLTGFYISEGIIHNKSSASLGSACGYWARQSLTTLKRNLQMDMLFELFKGIISEKKRSSTFWSSDAIFPSYISTSKQRNSA